MLKVYERAIADAAARDDAMLAALVRLITEGDLDRVKSQATIAEGISNICDRLEALERVVFGRRAA